MYPLLGAGDALTPVAGIGGECLGLRLVSLEPRTEDRPPGPDSALRLRLRDGLDGREDERGGTFEDFDDGVLRRGSGELSSEALHRAIAKLGPDVGGRHVAASCSRSCRTITSGLRRSKPISGSTHPPSASCSSGWVGGLGSRREGS